jgi:very-short-patch-repair endonuclease
MRREPTDAERKLWHALRDRRLDGLKFRRQVPIGNYIVDFICIEAKLIVEADGGQHAENTYDGERDDWLKAQGFTVLRFWNSEILNNIEGVMETIADAASPSSVTGLAAGATFSRRGRRKGANT